MATIQFSGIGSGLDVEGIVSKLMAVERRPLELLDAKKTAFNARVSAYGSMKSALATLQSAAAALAGTGKFLASKAALGDGTLASASTTQGAAAGVYSLAVQALASAQKLKTGPLPSSQSALGSGTLTIEFGSYAGGAFALNPDKTTRTIAIGAGQSSLAGVRDAINAADAGVSASIVNDGSGARLVLTSGESGVASALRITADDDDGVDTDAAGLSRLVYDASALGVSNLSETVPAADAIAVIDGITVTSATNTLSNAIEGVTLTLAKAAPGTTTTLTVARDVEGAKASIDAFIKAYNDAAKALRALSAYDPATKSAGPLQGDSALVSVQSRMRAALGSAVEFAGGYDTLSSLGIAFQKDGSLLADATKLRAALADTSRDAASAFAAVGTPSDSLVKFSAAAASAAAGNYALVVTQLATRGSAAGSQAAALTITAGVNDSLQVSVDGVAQTVTLAAGSYTAASLAAMLQSRIEGVEATESAGVLTLTSKNWGSTSTVAVTGGSAMADLFGTVSTAAGVNAAGSIGGTAATASGRNLTAKGLTVTVEGGATGARGSVRFSRGVADSLKTLIDDVLEDTIGSRTDGIAASLRSLAQRREVAEARLETVEKRLRAQFAALDSMMASMNTTSSYLSQQLAALPGASGK